MKHVVMAGTGDPDVLRMADARTPEPGIDEVAIRVQAAGINRPDLLQRMGRYAPPPDASPILGLEVAGTIENIGGGVTDWRVGDAVCALVPGGGYAEYAITPALQCLPIPAGFTMVQAAALPETAFTVWTNVFDRGRLRSGEDFLVHGGTSGIGTLAIQIAAARGARVFATAGTDAKCAFCRSIGATLAINHRTQDFVEMTLQATEQRGVDLILDMVGGDYVARNMRALAVEGRLVQIAFMTGNKVALDLAPLMMKRLTFTGSTLRPRSIADKGAIAAALRREVWPLIEAGQVRPIIHRTFAFDDVRDAHRELERGDHIGKIVLTMR